MSEKSMTAYPGGEEQKAHVIAELEAHRAADRLVKGRYWEDGKGQVTGCRVVIAASAQEKTQLSRGKPRR